MSDKIHSRSYPKGDNSASTDQKKTTSKRSGHTFQQNFTAGKLEKLKSPVQPSLDLSKQEIDAFRMKAFTLLTNHGFGFPSLSDQLQTIKAAPMQAAVEASIISISQTILTFPGEVITLKGSFKRDLERSCPIPDSFSLSAKSTHTAFPHPSQHTGWALADPLISKLSPIYERKAEIALKLEPRGELITVAKERLKQKKETLQVDLWVGLQLKLALKILQSSGHQFQTGNPEETIRDFYHFVLTLPDPYEYLSFIHAWINDAFIMHPYENLPKSKTSYSQALAFLETAEDVSKLHFEQQLKISQSDEEKCALRYILCMGNLLCEPVNAILLQDAAIDPEPLNAFAVCIQRMAYKQLEEFLNELENPQTPTDLLSQIRSDIAFLNS